MSANSWTDSLRDIGQDLITIEVNTIESTEISGRKMPGYPHALLDIAQKYADFLAGSAVGIDLDRLAVDFAGNQKMVGDAVAKLASPIKFDRRKTLRQQGQEALDSEMAGYLAEVKPQYTPGGKRYTVKLTNGWETFELLRWAANQTLSPPETENAATAPPQRPKLDRKTRGILWRIGRNCDQLKLVADELRDDSKSGAFIGKTRRELVSSEGKLSPISPQYLTRIRKAWDLGTDTIVLQTVVQLDGDITYRARPNLLRESQSPLLEAHNRATNVGLEHWQSLFQLVFSLLVDKIGRIFTSG